MVSTNCFHSTLVNFIPTEESKLFKESISTSPKGESLEADMNSDTISR